MPLLKSSPIKRDPTIEDIYDICSYQENLIQGGFKEFRGEFNKVHTRLGNLKADVSELKADMKIVKEILVNGWKPRENK